MSIKVCIGTEPKTAIAAQVLIHSIETRIDPRAKPELDFVLMEGPAWEYSIKGIKVGTGFSLRRWMIPKFCDWSGGAIYLDADQIVLGDLTELFDVVGRTARCFNKPIAWTTYQPDKYNKHPAPQTSVMVLDCENAEGKWGFDIDKVLAHLRGHPDKETYARFMHAEWLMPKSKAGTRPPEYLCFDEESTSGFNHPIKLPVEWNHLNVYEQGLTKLLHYTKEDAQPWYKPDHPLSHLWHRELEATMDAGRVTQEMLRFALAQWGKKEDWRPTNGLHPFYRRYLKA